MFLDLRICLGWILESIAGLEPWELVSFWEFSSSGRSEIHRSPRRAVILASRVASAARHREHFFLASRVASAARHSEHFFLASRVVSAARHSEHFPSPRELLLAARHGELIHSPREHYQFWKLWGLSDLYCVFDWEMFPECYLSLVVVLRALFRAFQVWMVGLW